MDKIYPFRGRGFHTPVEWKIGYKVINKQTSVQISIMNTAFYIYGNIRIKEISILNSFEQIQENTITGSAFSARQLGRGFHTRSSKRSQVKTAPNWSKRPRLQLQIGQNGPKTGSNEQVNVGPTLFYNVGPTE